MGVPSGTTTTSASATATTPSATASPTETATATAGPTTSPTTSASSSPTVTATGFACHVAYTKSSEWSGGFTASVEVENTGSTSLSSWNVGFTFGGDQKITSAWNEGSYTQSGAAVTVTNAAYNGSIAPGGNTSFGFQGTWTSSDAAPSSFTVNGTACT